MNSLDLSQVIGSRSTSCFNSLGSGYVIAGVTAVVSVLALEVFKNLPKEFSQVAKSSAAYSINFIKSGYGLITVTALVILLGLAYSFISNRNQSQNALKRLQLELQNKNPDNVFQPKTVDEKIAFAVPYNKKEADKIRELLTSILPEWVVNKLLVTHRENTKTESFLSWNGLRTVYEANPKNFPERDFIECAAQMLWVAGVEMPKLQAASMDLLIQEYFLRGDGDASSLTSEKNAQRLKDLTEKGFLSANLVEAAKEPGKR